MLTLEEKILAFKIILYASYLVFPVLLLCIVWFWKKKRKMAFLLIILSFLFIWARFIERNLITVQTTEIEVGFDAKIALIADLHVGVFKNDQFLTKVVSRINQLDVDLVLVAGDLLFEARQAEILPFLKPLSKIKKPVYVVLGNHDKQLTIPSLRKDLENALNDLGLRLITNKVVKLEQFTLVGLGDNFMQEDDITLLEQFSETDNVVVLTHNPDTVNFYTNNNADLTVTGHTHGGQVRIPWIYKKTIPTKGDFDQNYTQEKFTKLFVTSGLGEVLLPLRFLNPPVIDVLVLQ